MWREQYLAIRYSVPQVGWMLILMTMLFPAMVVAIPKKAMTRTAVWSSNLLHLLFSLVGLMVAVQHPDLPLGDVQCPAAAGDALCSDGPLVRIPGRVLVDLFLPVQFLCVSPRRCCGKSAAFVMVPLVLVLLTVAAVRNGGWRMAARAPRCGGLRRN